jgi:iron uptake system component EfeO
MTEHGSMTLRNVQLAQLLPLLAATVLPLAACGSSPPTDAEFQSQVVANMNQLLLGKVRTLGQAAREMCEAAPVPLGRGWDATDQPAIDQMKNAWNGMRSAWESAEGVLASLFPDLDETLDTRYEEFLSSPAGDRDLFDDQGFTGMHAIERILFAPMLHAAVVQKESTWPGYVAAVWPATQDQAAEFRNKLCMRTISDVQALEAGLTPGVIDLAIAFAGLTALMGEQKEKMHLAGDYVDESRYARRTLADLRANLAGTRDAYDLFVPWLNSKPDGMAVHDEVVRAFDRLDQTYSSVYGDAVPEPPVGWNSDLPSVADQATDFGRLYVAVVQEVDATYTGSAVDAMNHVARVLGLPEFVPMQ